jgi:hypothetical protein
VIRHVGETRLLCSTKPSKAVGNAIKAARSSAQTSAIMPGKVPCGVSRPVSGDDFVIHNGSDSLTVRNMHKADLEASDFVF